MLRRTTRLLVNETTSGAVAGVTELRNYGITELWNYGSTEIEFRFATPRLQDFGYARLQDNESTSRAEAGTTDLRNYGITELRKLRQDYKTTSQRDNESGGSHL